MPAERSRQDVPVSNIAHFDGQVHHRRDELCILVNRSEKRRDSKGCQTEPLCEDWPQQHILVFGTELSRHQQSNT